MLALAAHLLRMLLSGAQLTANLIAHKTVPLFFLGLEALLAERLEGPQTVLAGTVAGGAVEAGTRPQPPPQARPALEGAATAHQVRLLRVVV